MTIDRGRLVKTMGSILLALFLADLCLGAAYMVVSVSKYMSAVSKIR